MHTTHRQADLVDHPQRPDINTLNRNVRVKISAELLPMIYPFMAKNDIRYYLGGIRIERAADRPKGVYIVATNGHRLAVIYDPEGGIAGDEGRGVIMRVTPDLVRACRAPNRGITKMVLAAGLRVSVAPDFNMEHSELETYIMPGRPWVEGKYPDWRRVLPNFENLKPGAMGAVNAQYIKDYDVIAGDKYGAIKFWSADENSAVIVQIINKPNFLSIIMPMRADGNDALLALMKPMYGCKAEAVKP